MQPNYHPLVRIFGYETRHAVPLFQRPYVWTKDEQWAPLWDDVCHLADRVLRAAPNQPVAGHFLGTVVLEQSRNPVGTIGIREVIDGQQRLTTLQLLLKAAQHALAECQQRAREGDDDAGSNAAGIAARQLSALTLNPAYGAEEEKYKVWPTNEDRAAFREVMDAESPDDLMNASTRMADAYRFFLERIRTWIEQESVSVCAPALTSALKDHVRLIVLDLDNTDEPQAIFETLNAHGTPLLPADLMKNWLLWEAAKQSKDIDKLYQTYWRHFDQDGTFWRAVVGTGHAARARVDTFLQNWLTRHTREAVAAKHLYDRFLRQMATVGRGEVSSEIWSDIEHLMTDIRDDANRFRMIENPTGSSRFDIFLRRLRTMSVVVFHPVLLALLGRAGTDPNDLCGVAVALESYLVRRMVCGQQTRGYGALALSLLEAIAAVDGPATPIVRKCLAEAPGTASWPDDETFRARWCSRPFYNNLRRDRVLMILQAIEEFYQLQGTMGEPIVQFDFSALEIEHVLPQAWEPHWPLAADDPARANRNLRLNGIGNLTLVSGRLNPSLSNAAWHDGEKNGTLLPGKRTGLMAHSKLQLNARLVNAYPTSWDESGMDHRAMELFEVARQIWPRPPGQRAVEVKKGDLTESELLDLL